MLGLKELKRTLQRLGQPELPRAERRPAPGLAAYGLEASSNPAKVKDISSSGIYLFTEKRLATGEVVNLRLQEQSDPENSIELRFMVEARMARQGEDGIGLSFLLPPGLDTNLWGVLVRNIVILTDREQIAHMFRTLRTILFMCRLCQAEAEEAIVLLGGQLDADRTEMLVKIALSAEDQLATEPDAGRMRAHPKMLASILREGSWANDELVLKLWTGLLASSCSVDTPDESNQVFANLLVHVTAPQAKIFVYACERALASAPGAEEVPAGTVVLNAKGMVDLTGWSDPTRNATDTAYLFNLGLAQKLFDFTSYHDSESFDITPSRLGIALYKRCHGWRGKVDQQLADAAKAHLDSFLPQAQPAYVAAGAAHATHSPHGD